jgi:hypothetical protein
LLALSIRCGLSGKIQIEFNNPFSSNSYAMSLHLINQYHNELDRIQRFSGSKNEDTVKGAFANLVNGLARQKNLGLMCRVHKRSIMHQNQVENPKG